MPKDLLAEQPTERIDTSGVSGQPRDLLGTSPARERPLAQRSPLSFIERGKFAFGDVPGRRSFLEEKFPKKRIEQLPSGKFSVDGVPVDPEGFEIGDIADIADEVVRLGFQIKGAAIGGAVTGLKGAALGVPAGPGGVVTGGVTGTALGVIGGGALGRAGGQTAVEALGRGFGVRKSEAIDVAKDILREGAIGAFGEAVGVAIKPIGKATASFVRRIFTRVQKKATKPAIQNLFNFTAGIDKESINRVQARGADIVLTRKNMSNESVLGIANKINSGINKLRQMRGKIVGRVKKEITISPKGRISISGVRRQFDKRLQDIGILDKNFNVKPSLGIRDKEVTNKLLRVKDILANQKSGKIQPNLAIRLKDELDDIVKFAKEGKLVVGTKEDAVIKSLSRNIGKQLEVISPELKQANKLFADIAQLENTLRTRLSLPAGENTLKNLLKRDAFTRQKLIELNKILPKKDKFMEELLDVIAARDFSLGTFKAIQSRSFTSLLGGGLGFAAQRSPGGVLTGAATGIALSTPKVVGHLLRGQQFIGKGIERGLLGAGRATGRILPKAISAEESRKRRLLINR